MKDAATKMSILVNPNGKHLNAGLGNGKGILARTQDPTSEA